MVESHLPPGKLHTAIGQHAEVVIEAAVTGEQIHRRRRPREIIPQHFFRHAPVKAVIPRQHGQRNEQKQPAKTSSERTHAPQNISALQGRQMLRWQ